MKTSCPLLRLIPVFLFCAAAPLRAEPVNAYDQLGRTLVPIASIFSPQNEQRALTATLVLEEMTGLPTEQAGGRLELFLEPPAHVLLRGSFAGQTMAGCRTGQELWLEPGSKVSALLPPPPDRKPGKKKKKKERDLAPMALPFPPQQLVLLPVLFSVTEGNPADGLRVLEVRLMQQLADSLGISDWSARLFYRGEELAKLEILRPGWHVVVRVDRLELLKTLPPATWEPASDDVLRLTSREAHRWLEIAGKRLTRESLKSSGILSD